MSAKEQQQESGALQLERLDLRNLVQQSHLCQTIQAPDNRGYAEVMQHFCGLQQHLSLIAGARVWERVRVCVCLSNLRCGCLVLVSDSE